MIHKCNRCDKTFASHRNVQAHMVKRESCDTTCNLCGEKHGDESEYIRHMRTKHPKQKRTRDSTKQPVIKNIVAVKTEERPKNSIDYLALDDFNWRHLEILCDKEVREARIEKTVMLPNGVRRLELVGTETTLTFNAQKAMKYIKYIKSGILDQALLCLEYDDDYLAPLAVRLLNAVHAERDIPELLSLRAKDINRKRVLIHVRPDPTTESLWVCNSNKVGLTKVKHHCQELFKFVLHIATAFLIPMTCRTYGEYKPCLTLPNSDPDVDSQTVLLLKVGAEMQCGITVETCKKRHLRPYCGEDDEQMTNLKEVLEEFKNAIFNKIDECEIPENDLNVFLENAKDAGIGFDIPNYV